MDNRDKMKEYESLGLLQDMFTAQVKKTPDRVGALPLLVFF